MMKIDASNSDLHNRGEIGGFYIRPWSGKKGDIHKGHSHHIDHVGVLVSGQAQIRWRKEDGSAEGVVDVLVPAKVLIRADCWHEIEAMSDVLNWECWFAAAEADRVYGTTDVPWYLEKE